MSTKIICLSVLKNKKIFFTSPLKIIVALLFAFKLFTTVTTDIQKKYLNLFS